MQELKEQRQPGKRESTLSCPRDTKHERKIPNVNKLIQNVE
jgi:hypothetical protein